MLEVDISKVVAAIEELVADAKSIGESKYISSAVYNLEMAVSNISNHAAMVEEERKRRAAERKPIRGTFVFRNGRMVPKHEAMRGEWEHRMSVRGDVAAPAIRRDSMDEFVSLIDGKTVFDSKSAWERHVKANGCEIVGNDTPPASKRFIETEAHTKSVQKDIVEAFHMVENGYVPQPMPDVREIGLDIGPVRDEYVRTEAVSID